MKSKIIPIPVLILISLILLGLRQLAAQVITEAERQALIDLYNSTDGDNWYDNSGWKEPPLHTDGFAMPGTEGTWRGVTCTGDHVTQISLGWNNLVGTIP